MAMPTHPLLYQLPPGQDLCENEKSICKNLRKQAHKSQQKELLACFASLIIKQFKFVLIKDLTSPKNLALLKKIIIKKRYNNPSSKEHVPSTQKGKITDP